MRRLASHVARAEGAAARQPPLGNLFDSTWNVEESLISSVQIKLPAMI